MSDAVSRRAVLLGAAGLALAACSGGARTGPTTATQVAAPNSPEVPEPGLPTVAWASGTTSAEGSFDSRFRHTRVGWRVVRPVQHGRIALPVLVVLHGRGGNHDSAFGSLHLDTLLARYVRRGGHPYAIASVDGGDAEYWHPRAHTDPAGMVIHEFLPLLADQGYSTRRVAFLGWSMGGYGSLYLGTVLGRTRVAAIVAESPAIWEQPGLYADGAFDSTADHVAHQIFGRQHLLNGIALRSDCGAADGFAPAVRDLRTSLHPTPAGGIEPGDHNETYWRTQAAAQLAFVGEHLR